MVDVLLVEDESWVRTALRKVIEQTGLPLKVVHETGDGRQASDWLRLNRVDLVMTDIRMPTMDGLELLGEIKRSGYACDVIVVSGHDDFAYVRDALRLGAVDYLLKPVETSHIQACFQHWTERQNEQFLTKANDLGEFEIDTQSAVQQVISFIEKHRAFTLTSREAADLVHLNPSYFSKLFRITMSMTFTDYMTMVRMDEARRLLACTSMRICEIAERVGFSDTAYFSNTFRKNCGRAPSEYRKQYIPGMKRSL